MIELKKIFKTYFPNDNNSIIALKNISMKLPSKGIFFILGKSGSGKSTLLNILGGLDNPTSGEVLFKGKSQTGFSQKDYDSYRNNSIGFIFQEYNLINDLSIEDNLSLVLSLRNDKNLSQIKEILKVVDLEGYEKRMPYELSGGQKQRVAIARALLKNPSIILADEPTGNLDLENSKQIFDLLKSLSQDRLVVVVTHDRESAELYSEGIVELADGEIISNSIPEIADDTAEKVEISKSYISLKNIFSMTRKSLKNHWIRVFMTIFLSFFAFSFFGIADTIYAYSRIEATAKTLSESNQTIFQLNKKEIVESTYYYDDIDRRNSDKLTITDINELTEKTGIEFVGTPNGECLDVYYDNNPKYNGYDYVLSAINLTTALPEDYLSNKSPLLSGKLPEKKFQVVLGESLYRYFKAFGFKDCKTSEFFSPEQINLESLIGKFVNLNLEQPFEITGFSKADFDFSEYEKAREIPMDKARTQEDSNFLKEFMNNIKNDYYSNAAFLSDEFYQYYLSAPNYANNWGFQSLYFINPKNTSALRELTKISCQYPITNPTSSSNSKPVEKGTYYCIYSNETSSLNRMDYYFTVTRRVFLGLSLIMGFFSTLMLYHFISLTIKDEQKTIGILRALGASGKNVFWIYFAKALAVAFPIYILSLVSTFAIGFSLNVILSNHFLVKLSMLTPGVRQIIILLLLNFIISFIATFLPINKIARMKPIDAIKRQD